MNRANLEAVLGDLPYAGADGTSGLRVGPRVRVGIDVADVAEVEASMLRYGDRYERRLFTDRERADATGAVPVRAASLAARFAAKEAVLKILTGGDPPPWRSIEVRRAPGSSPELHLHGDAARLAAEAGLCNWSVSLTHSAGIAAAIVAATVTDKTPSGHTTNEKESP